jgi:hypothetical protein
MLPSPFGNLTLDVAKVRRDVAKTDLHVAIYVARLATSQQPIGNISTGNGSASEPR